MTETNFALEKHQRPQIPFSLLYECFSCYVLTKRSILAQRYRYSLDGFLIFLLRQLSRGNKYFPRIDLLSESATYSIHQHSKTRISIIVLPCFHKFCLPGLIYTHTLHPDPCCYVSFLASYIHALCDYSNTPDYSNHLFVNYYDLQVSSCLYICILSCICVL